MLAIAECSVLMDARAITILHGTPILFNAGSEVTPTSHYSFPWMLQVSSLLGRALKILCPILVQILEFSRLKN
mgnify:CR=1 FL=1